MKMESHNISKGGACIRVVAPSGTSTKTWNFHLTQSTNGQCFVQMPLTLHFSHSVGVFCCLPTASCKWTTHTGTHTGTAPVNLNYRPRYVQSMPIITHVHGAQKSIRHSIDVWTRGSGPCKTPVLRHAALEVDHPSSPPPTHTYTHTPEQEIQTESLRVLLGQSPHVPCTSSLRAQLHG